MAAPPNLEHPPPEFPLLLNAPPEKHSPDCLLFLYYADSQWREVTTLLQMLLQCCNAALQPIVATHPPATQGAVSACPIATPSPPFVGRLLLIKGRPIPTNTKHCGQPSILTQHRWIRSVNMSNCHRPLVSQSMTFHHWSP